MRHGLSPEFLDPEEIAGLQSRKGYYVHKREEEETHHMNFKFLGLRVWALGGVVLALLVVAGADFLLG